jgi:Spy/CpxP family protein refolding chaperone
MNTLKKMSLITLFSLAFSSQFSFADDGKFVERKLKHMTEKLALSPEQRVKIKAVLEEDEKQRELHRVEFKKQFDAILTAEQKTKLEQDWQQRKDKKPKKGIPPEGDFERCDDIKK